MNDDLRRKQTEHSDATNNSAKNWVSRMLSLYFILSLWVTICCLQSCKREIKQRVELYGKVLWNNKGTGIVCYYSFTTHFNIKNLIRLWAGWSGFDSRQGQRFFLFATSYRPALRPIQLPIQ